MMRAAGIDCGTNSIRLLIADVDGDQLTDVVRELRIVRLGQGVDETGRLAPGAIERTRNALLEYHSMMNAHHVEAVRMVATSATRDAKNREEFQAIVRDILGIDPEVITGHEEAALSFHGAINGLPGLSGAVLVADIGGGSTELVRGKPGGEELQAHSMDVGCVRMTERHLRSDPPTTAQIAATVTDLEQAMTKAAGDVPLVGAGSFVGVAGTVTTVAAIAMGLERYEADIIHGTAISAEQVDEVTERLLGMTHAERAGLPVMHPGRVDVIGGGALVLRTLMERTESREVIASEHDILDGITRSAASHR